MSYKIDKTKMKILKIIIYYKSLQKNGMMDGTAALFVSSGPSDYLFNVRFLFVTHGLASSH